MTVKPGTGSSIERTNLARVLGAAGSKARDVGLVALGVLLVPALAAYVVLGSRSTTFFRERW